MIDNNNKKLLQNNIIHHETFGKKSQIKEKENLLKELNEKCMKKNGDLENKVYYKLCDTCHLISEIKYYIGNKNNETKQCLICRERNSRADANRKNRKRNWKEELDKNPERKAKKQLWKEQNAELIRKYYTESRMIRKERMGIEEYLKLMAIQQKEWRDKNPEKNNMIKERAKRSIIIRIGIYKYSAKKRGLEFNLTDEECKNFFLSECKGCGEKDPDGKLCGIDRINNEVGYIYDNCRSFCVTCNFIKKTMTDE
jgi:hypothetical protein